jgi:hypothetical protein
MLVAHDRLDWLQVAELGLVGSRQDATDRRLGHTDALGDARLQHAAPTQLHDEERLGRINGLWRERRARGGIGQRSLATGHVASQPLPRRGRSYTV